MGIHGLMKLIGDYAPAAMKDNEIKSYFGERYGALYLELVSYLVLDPLTIDALMN